MLRGACGVGRFFVPVVGVAAWVAIAGEGGHVEMDEGHEVLVN